MNLAVEEKNGVVTIFDDVSFEESDFCRRWVNGNEQWIISKGELYEFLQNLKKEYKIKKVVF